MSVRISRRGVDIDILSCDIVRQLRNSGLTLFFGDIETIVGGIRIDIFVVSHDGD